MEFERINYDELKQIAPFSIYIFEYFKNDFYVIKDFLQCKSPWDKNIKWFLNLSDDELIDKKREMFKSILKVYYDIIETPMFEQEGEMLYPYQLSSGEKQLLVILLTVLVQDGQPCVLFMDEPEVSLHIEWQQHLIELIRRLNHNVQIILTTHSPAVIMNGWQDAVTEVSDITE